MNIGRSVALGVCLGLLVLAGDAYGIDWHHAAAPGDGCRKMAVAPDGSLYMATRNALSRWNGTGWETEEIPGMSDQQGSVASVDLRFSSDGRPHVLYTYPYGTDVVYCTKTAGVWSREYVTQAAAGGAMSASIALDPTGKPYVPVVLGEINVSEKLYLMTRTSPGVWSQTPVDTSPRAAWWPDMEYSASNNMRIVYTTGGSDDLNMAWYRNGIWTIQTLDSFGATGWGPTLKMTSNYLSRISYWNASEQRCYLQVEPVSGSFVRYLVDPDYAQLCDLNLMTDGTSLVTYVLQAGYNNYSPSGIRFATVKNGVIKRYQVGDATATGTMYKDYFTSALVGNDLFVSYTGGQEGGELWWGTIPEPSSITALLAGLVWTAPLIIRRRKAISTGRK